MIHAGHPRLGVVSPLCLCLPRPVRDSIKSNGRSVCTVLEELRLMCGEGGFAGFALMGSAIWVAVTGLVIELHRLANALSGRGG